jgi:hypothetical protein
MHSYIHTCIDKHTHTHTHTHIHTQIAVFLQLNLQFPLSFLSFLVLLLLLVLLSDSREPREPRLFHRGCQVKRVKTEGASRQLGVLTARVRTVVDACAGLYAAAPPTVPWYIRLACVSREPREQIRSIARETARNDLRGDPRRLTKCLVASLRGLVDARGRHTPRDVEFGSHAEHGPLVCVLVVCGSEYKDETYHTGTHTQT